MLGEVQIDTGVFANVSFIVIVGGLMVVLTLLLGWLPGSIARRRGHPNADAIAIAGWIGIFFVGIIWFVALIWAHTGPDNSKRIRQAWHNQRRGDFDSSIADALGDLERPHDERRP